MAKPEFYIYYEKSSGIIKKISGKKEDIFEDTDILEANYAEVKDIYEGKKSFNDYIVSYDIKLKSFSLILKDINIKTFDINEYLFKIPLLDDTNSDLVVVQNFKKMLWEIKINKKIIQSVKENGVSSYSKLFFSITKKDDPNIIYRSFRFNINEILEKHTVTIPFVCYQEELENVSVFTNKYFDTYSYKVKHV